MSGLGEAQPKAPVRVRAPAAVAIVLGALALGRLAIMKTFGMQMSGD